MKVTIRQIKKAQNPPEKDAYHAVIFGRKISPYFTWGLLRLGFNPNLITIISLFFIIIGSCFFTFSFPQYWILGWVILQGYHILDSCDGEVARLKKNTSKFGGMFDSMLHPLGNAIVFAAASIGIYKITGNVFILYFGFLTVIVLLMLSIVRLHGAIRVGKEKKYVLDQYTSRATFKGKLCALFTEVGGPFNMLVLVALFDFITGLNLRTYFFMVFTVGILILLIKKITQVKRDLER